MSQFSRYPGAGSASLGGGVPAYYNFAALPTTAPDGALAVTLADDSLYIFDGATATWLALASVSNVLTIGTIDSQAKSANGGVVSATQLYFQTADDTHPGLMSATTQTLGGAKTFTGAGVFSSTLGVAGNFAVATDKFTVVAASGNAAIAGTLNVTGASTLAALGATSGTFSLTLAVTGNFSVNSTKFTVNASTGDATVAGALAVTGAVSGSNLSGTNTGDVTLAAVGSSPSANGASLSSQVLTLQPADGTHPGVITSGTQTIGGAKTFSGAGVFSTTLDVTGNFNVATNKFSVVAASGNTTIAGTLALTSDLAIATNKFTVTASTGNTSVAGTLGVAGAVTNSSTTQMTGNVGIGGASAAAQVTCTRPTALTGTWSNSAGGTAVTGVGTKAMSELVIGCNFIINGETVVITAITTDTAITTATITGANSGVAATTTAVTDHYVYSNGCFQSGGTRTSLVLSGQSNTNLIVGDAATAGGTSNNTPSLMVLAYSGTSATTSGQLVMAKSRGNEAGPVTVSSGDRMGLVVSKAYDGTSLGAGQRITFLATETWGSSAHGCKMQLATVANTTTASVVGLEIGSEGDVVLGPQAANATSATGGYTYMPTCAGTPTGVPVGYTGKVAWIYDTSNNIIYIYNGGWKKTVALT